jgi:hypothetical protein
VRELSPRERRTKEGTVRETEATRPGDKAVAMRGEKDEGERERAMGIGMGWDIFFFILYFIFSFYQKRMPKYHGSRIKV